MVFEMLFSLALIVIALFCLGYVHTTAAATTYTDPLGTGFWPQVLLILLIVLLVINIIQIYRKTPKEERNLNVLKQISLQKILQNHLAWGIVVLVLYALLIPYTGFLLTSFVMCIAMSYCLGEKRPGVLVGFSFIAVIVVFIIFFKGMSIQLPRGTIPFLRNFALTIESFLRNIGQ